MREKFSPSYFSINTKDKSWLGQLVRIGNKKIKKYVAKKGWN